MGGTCFLSPGDKRRTCLPIRLRKAFIKYCAPKCRLAFAVSSVFGGGLGLVARSGKLTGGCRVFELASADISP